VTQPAARNGSTSARKDDLIQIRASAGMKAMLSRAASLRGQTLSEFMLDSARREAEQAILDPRVSFLNAKQHEQFLAMLDAPIRRFAELKALIKCKLARDR
jgi:uncharacterized protein (DUF1778 family)